jgi:hypothetical protein
VGRLNFLYLLSMTKQRKFTRNQSIRRTPLKLSLISRAGHESPQETQLPIQKKNKIIDAITKYQYNFIAAEKKAVSVKRLESLERGIGHYIN